MMSGKKILVVDDEIHIVHVVAIKLRNNGYDVITAENGALALAAALQEKPDVIVTDFQMPEMTGLELVEAVRNNPDLADIPIIMLTARGFAIDSSQQQQLRISECLSKPFSPKELLRTVEDVLHQAAVTQ
jgi:two-component system alkaline phosphatase synthesis response regulator PhoP